MSVRRKCLNVDLRDEEREMQELAIELDAQGQRLITQSLSIVPSAG